MKLINKRAKPFFCLDGQKNPGIKIADNKPDFLSGFPINCQGFVYVATRAVNNHILLGAISI